MHVYKESRLWGRYQGESWPFCSEIFVNIFASTPTNCNTHMMPVFIQNHVAFWFKCCFQLLIYYFSPHALTKENTYFILLFKELLSRDADAIQTAITPSHWLNDGLWRQSLVHVSCNSWIALMRQKMPQFKQLAILVLWFEWLMGPKWNDPSMPLMYFERDWNIF